MSTKKILLAFLALIVSVSAFSQGYDTIIQQNKKLLPPDQNNTLFHLKVLNTKKSPLRNLPVYLVDESGNTVYHNKTNLEGIASFRIPNGNTYVIDINNTKAYDEVIINETPYLTQSSAIMFNPERFKPSKKADIPIPLDTIIQNHTALQQETRDLGNVIITVLNHHEYPVKNTSVYLNNPGKRICYINKTDNDGKAWFLLPNGYEYKLSFRDSENHSEIKLPKRAYLNMQYTLHYTPTKLDESISNDTIIQRFEHTPEPTTTRAFVEVEVTDNEDNPRLGYPVLIEDISNDSVFISYTNNDGLAWFLLPKGIKYRLSFSMDDYTNYIYFKDDQSYQTNRITFSSNGLLANEQKYQQVEMIYPLAEYLYKNLPVSASMEQYCPPVGDQGQYGTCVGWATAYYAHSILEAIGNNESKPANFQKIYSPTWVYEQVKFSFDHQCAMGTYIESALKLLKNKGDVSMRKIPYACGAEITDMHNRAARFNKILDYRRIFSWNAGNNTKIKAVKKSVSEHQPVVIGFKTVTSFHQQSGSLWTPGIGESPSSLAGGHAMTVVGYDDNKHGGAFRLINSWNTNWGDNGYCWVKYNDFANYCFSAFEIFENPVNDSEDAVKLDVEIDIMKPESGSIIFNKTDDNLDQYIVNSGKLNDIELKINTSYPSYVYVLAVNKNGVIEQIYPDPYKGLSNYLGYKSNSIITEWKNAEDWNKLIFIFTKNDMDFYKETSDLNNSNYKGFKAIYKRYSSRIIKGKNINFNNDKIKMKAEFENNAKILVFGLSIKEVEEN